MNKITSPTDFHPHLLLERLTLVAEVVATAKNEMFESAEPTKGDGGWGLGCHGADRGRLRLRDLAETTEWLDYKAEGSLAYWIQIGDVPVRISRVDTDPPISERRRAALLQLSFPGFEAGASFVDVRLQLDQTNTQVLKERRVERVFLCILEGDNEVGSWQVWPQAEAGLARAPLGAPSPLLLRAVPISLPEAEFSINDDKDNAGSGD